MNDLRSLEGVGNLLQEKMVRPAPLSGNMGTSIRHVRSSSNPVPSMKNSSNNISMSSYFTPQLAATIANGIQIGYYSKATDKPFLKKSHSGFAQKELKDILPKLDLEDYKSNGSNVSFKLLGNTSPQQSFELTQEYEQHINQYNTTVVRNRGNGISNHASNDDSIKSRKSVAFDDHVMASSPSMKLGSLRSGSLHLDFDYDLNEDSQTPRLSLFSIGRKSVTFGGRKSLEMNTIYSPEVMEFNDKNLSLESPKSPKSPHFLPSLQMQVSNKSLFSLCQDEEMMSSAEDLLAKNTAFNAAELKEDVSGISDVSNYSNQSVKEFVDEDFMNFESDPQQNGFSNIGDGASGIVRKAFHIRSCCMVAIKKCRSKQKSAENAFIREAKMYQIFEDNANIVNILGYGKDKNDNGSLSMAMEYMDLGSCESLKIASNKSISLETKELAVGHIIFNTLRALSALHNNLYIHNDVKPANILSNKYGEIKLSDFGTVIKLKKQTSFVKKNCGTQRFQSPEKLVETPIRYNTKNDIWSLGVTAYELLLGDIENGQDELAFVTNSPKLNTKQHKISPFCCDFINKCLTKNYKERPSADDLLEHEWFTQSVIKNSLHSKWPWLVEIDGDDQKQHDIMAAIDTITNKEKKKKVAFADDVIEKNANKNMRNHEYYNEDLLFMISALIIYYSTQSVNFEKHHSHPSRLFRRQSAQNADSFVGKIYSDDARINNIAKYALCTKQMVLERIRVTVAFIKSQINSL